MIQWILAIWSLVPLPFLNVVLTSGSSSVIHVLLKPGLANFEHYFASVWDECKCAVAWTLFGIDFLWDWHENWFFSLVPTPEFSKFARILSAASSFKVWNSSTGIPAPPLSLFIVMLPKAHLTSHSRMSGSRWVIIPLWLSGSWRSLYVHYTSILSWWEPVTWVNEKHSKQCMLIMLI